MRLFLHFLFLVGVMAATVYATVRHPLPAIAGAVVAIAAAVCYNRLSIGTGQDDNVDAGTISDGED